MSGKETLINMFLMVFRCPIGYTRMECSSKGVHSIALMHSHDDAVTMPRGKNFLHAPLLEENQLSESAQSWKKNFLDAFSFQKPRIEIPLVQFGTEFQYKVWDELSKIPPGKTLSYSDIAHRIEAPTAVRAVAQACHANEFAFLVPCHRVIAKDGSLGGYRWGAEQKQKLLELESSAVEFALLFRRGAAGAKVFIQ